MRIVALFCLLSALGCSAYDDLHLFEVDGVEPDQVEEGGTLRVHGEGFPLGREARVVFSGELRRPGQPSIPLRVSLPGEVRNESLIEVPIEEELIEEIGGRGTFDGGLRVTFRAANDTRDVFAEQRVLVDFLPDTSLQLGAETTLEESPSRLGAAHFGVVLSREETGIAGVTVEAVEPGGLAARQGVRPGDVLVELDGLRLYSWRDFLPDPTTSESTIAVARPGLGGVHSLRWPHDATASRADSLAAFVLLLLGFVLGWCSPAVLGLTALARGSTEAWLTRLSSILVLSSVLFTVSTVRSIAVWIVALGILAALFSVAARDRTAAVRFPFVLTSALTIMIVGRSADLTALVELQGGGPLHWFALQSPASTCALIGYLYALGSLTRWTRLSASLYAAAGSVLGAALFFGGWDSSEPIEGMALLVVKSALLFLTACMVRIPDRVALTSAILGLVFAASRFIGGIDVLSPFWSLLLAGAIGALVLRGLVPPLRRPSAPALS